MCFERSYTQEGVQSHLAGRLLAASYGNECLIDHARQIGKRHTAAHTTHTESTIQDLLSYDTTGPGNNLPV